MFGKEEKIQDDVFLQQASFPVQRKSNARAQNWRYKE
jgi:hypothetical protein